MPLRCVQMYRTYVESEVEADRITALASLRAEAPVFGLLCYDIHPSTYAVVTAMANMTLVYFRNCGPALPLRDPSPVVLSSGFVAAQGVQRVAPRYQMVRVPWMRSAGPRRSANLLVCRIRVATAAAAKVMTSATTAAPSTSL
jgi:hypothetical protein